MHHPLPNTDVAGEHGQLDHELNACGGGDPLDRDEVLEGSLQLRVFCDEFAGLLSQKLDAECCDASCSCDSKARVARPPSG